MPADKRSTYTYQRHVIILHTMLANMTVLASHMGMHSVTQLLLAGLKKSPSEQEPIQ